MRKNFFQNFASISSHVGIINDFLEKSNCLLTRIGRYEKKRHPNTGDREMRLVPITYKLDEYELPDHLFLTGELDIEMDHVDGQPYIWAFQLMVHNGETGISVEHEYQQGRKDNWPSSVDLLKELHRDKKLMDDIFDECAREGMWSE